MSSARFFKLVLGLLLIIAGVYLVVFWWRDFLTLLKGGIPVLIALVGLVFLLLGFEK